MAAAAATFAVLVLGGVEGAFGEEPGGLVGGRSARRLSNETAERETVLTDKASKRGEAPTRGDIVGPPTKTTTTTHAIACDKLCTVNGEAATCKDQIQMLSMRDFLGDVNSCDLAQASIVGTCPFCADCPVKQAGCGILELPTTASPTTTLPPGGACVAVCELGGQNATCESRMKWSVKHVFMHKYDACASAHRRVTQECPVCGKCDVREFRCKDPQIRDTAHLLQGEGDVTFFKKYDSSAHFRFLRGRQQTEALAAAVLLCFAALSTAAVFAAFSLAGGTAVRAVQSAERTMLMRERLAGPSSLVAEE